MRHKRVESCPGGNSLGTLPPMGLGISYLRREGSRPAHLGFLSENDCDLLDPYALGHLRIGNGRLGRTEINTA